MKASAGSSWEVTLGKSYGHFYLFVYLSLCVYWNYNKIQHAQQSKLKGLLKLLNCIELATKSRLQCPYLSAYILYPCRYPYLCAYIPCLCLQAELGLNEHHQNEAISYMRFARFKRGLCLKTVDSCFQDLKDSRYHKGALDSTSQGGGSKNRAGYVGNNCRVKCFMGDFAQFTFVYSYRGKKNQFFQTSQASYF